MLHVSLKLPLNWPSCLFRKGILLILSLINLILLLIITIGYCRIKYMSGRKVCLKRVFCSNQKIYVLIVSLLMSLSKLLFRLTNLWFCSNYNKLYFHHHESTFIQQHQCATGDLQIFRDSCYDLLYLSKGEQTVEDQEVMDQLWTQTTRVGQLWAQLLYNRVCRKQVHCQSKCEKLGGDASIT